MSFEVEKDIVPSDSVVITVQALEYLVKGDRVVINNYQATKDPDGPWIVISPNPTEATNYCEVREGYFKTSPGGSVGPDTSIYNGDGQLSGNRVVDQNGNDLNFNGGAFAQERQQGTSILRIENNETLSGLGANGTGMTQEANGFLATIFTGDASLVGGRSNQGSLIVINDDFTTIGTQVVNLLTVDDIEAVLRSLKAGVHQSEVKVNEEGITLLTSGSAPPETGVKITRLVGNSGLLGHNADGYITSVSQNVPAFDKQTVSLTANTPLTISSAVVSDIHSIEFYDSLGEKIDLRIAKTANDNERILESNTNLNNITVYLTGIL